MLQAAAIFLLFCLAGETSRKIYRERAVFLQHQQTTIAAWLVWLCPLPLILPFVSREFWLLFFPLPLASLFFLPAIVVARGNHRCFDKSGDDRVKPAAAAVDQLVTFGLMGMAGMLVFTLLLWFRNH